MKGVKIAVSDVKDGNFSFKFDCKAIVVKNREKFLKTNGFSKLCAPMRVESLDSIIDIDEIAGIDFSRELKCDALITNKKIALMLPTGDCFPCVVFDPKLKVLALLHLGWKPVSLRLPEKVIKHLKEKYNSSASDMKVWFGPGISAESYVVENPEQINDPRWSNFVTEVQGGVSVAVESYAISQFEECGINLKNISRSKVDTFTSKKYFSHKRAQETRVKDGRFVTCVEIE